MHTLVNNARAEIKENLRNVTCLEEHRILTANQYDISELDEMERRRMAQIVRGSIFENQTPVMNKLSHLKHSLLQLVLGEALTNAFVYARPNRFEQELVTVILSTCPNYVIIIIRNTTDRQNIFENKPLPVCADELRNHEYGSGIIDDIIKNDFSGQIDRKIIPNEKIDLVSVLNFGN